MVLDKDTAKKTAELLLQINAIKLKPENPFTWASGWKSPIYCDNRILLSYPAIRNYIRDEMAKQVELLYGKPDCIVGVATGAIGIGALVADKLNLPFVYVRPEPKSHGRQNQIEGHLEAYQTVVVIEDLISTGKSSLNAVDALRAVDANVKGMLAIFTYGFETALNNFKEKNTELHTLSSYQYLIEQASDTGYVKEAQLNTLMEWRKDPSQWTNK
ncbi:orotate phosphoribosyltransferase [Maribacter hydrothermalis]|uniref:Orotate phosphoribosyltransferase n=1 Tax=Maribacter hydrothermalis TaxID=1836467 RepID=A0A1B7ZBE6_9FLAO|nr:orotate phosphoribosyltransferase [Maribacter hydrothermalis]APQ16462.1 orotate phosphoribosyltransferase [Maribacter hydrothermalis]OBR40026.1 orotate phosphoribosyltransferase [Maribacter hydrothermalis]